jgi:hypothetical protein
MVTDEVDKVDLDGSELEEIYEIMSLKNPVFEEMFMSSKIKRVSALHLRTDQLR